MMNVSLSCNVELRSQEMKLELLTILKTSMGAYTVGLPRYAYTVLTRDRSIDNSAHRFESAISRYLSRPAIRSIDSFSFVATNMFIVQGLQYSILHFDFP